MDNINVNSTPAKQKMDRGIRQQSYQAPVRWSVKLLSFVGAFFILLAFVFAVNVATINTVAAKSDSAEHQVKQKKHSKSRSSRKSRRYKKSRKSRKRGKRYKTRYKKSRRYRKNKKRYKKRSRKSKRARARNGKRFYKARYSKSKKRFSKIRKKSRKKSRRGRGRTCDQLSSSTLNRKARRYQKTIRHAAKQNGVSQHFIKAVITVETCFRSGLRGTSGEKGLMQLMPATGKRFGVKNRFSTWQNIHGGARYLKYLLRRFNGNKAYAAAAYNGGAGAVSRTRGPKFEAVRRYSRMVMNAYRKFKPRRIKVRSKKRKISRRKKRS